MAVWPLLDSSSSWQGGASETDSSQVTVTGSATANVKGAWTELVASSGQTSVLVLSVRVSSAAASDTAVLIDIGVGPAGSEVVVCPNIDMGGRNGIFTLFLPLALAAGTRVSARLQSTVVSKTVELQAFGLGGGMVPPEGFRRAVTYGADTATSAGTPLTAAAATNVKSAWTELVASSTDPIKMLVPFPSKPAGAANSGANGLIDIGVGPAGSEVVILSNLRFESYSSEVFATVHPWVPCQIPVGSRLAARYQATSTAAQTNPRLTVVTFG